MDPIPKFYVHDIPVYGDLILAPMDGYSDQPFRSLCRQLGSAMSYTEFISAVEVLQDSSHLLNRLAFLQEERPVVFQLFDNDPERLLKAALKLRERDPDIIDVNMGCSARSVSARGAGAGMLRDPRKAAKVIELLRGGLDIPVTAKIRLGWDETSRNYLEIARALEESGCALIAVHGRTKVQGYSGVAEWEAIAEIKHTVSIPVIANGDVNTTDDIERILALTGCEAVMVGRAAIGNPWIFSRRNREDVSEELVRSTMLTHLERMVAFYGEERGMVLFRKHASRYLRPCSLGAEDRRRLFTCARPAEFLRTLESLSL
jgi:tRNA-dihydrouridine synthase B